MAALQRGLFRCNAILQSNNIKLIQNISCRLISVTDADFIKRKWISKWKNSFPDQVYSEAEWLEESCFDKILGVEAKSKERRRRMFKALLDRLVTQERVVVSYTRGKGLARLAELLIDTAKKGDEPAVYRLMQRKELIPKVFDELLPRFQEQNGNYTTVYRVQSEALPRYHKKKLLYRKDGNLVVEFNGHSLPPMMPTRDEMEELTLRYFENMKEKRDQEVKGSEL